MFTHVRLFCLSVYLLAVLPKVLTVKLPGSKFFFVLQLFNLWVNALILISDILKAIGFRWFIPTHTAKSPAGHGFVYLSVHSQLTNE